MHFGLRVYEITVFRAKHPFVGKKSLLMHFVLLRDARLWKTSLQRRARYRVLRALVTNYYLLITWYLSLPPYSYLNASTMTVFAAWRAGIMAARIPKASPTTTATRIPNPGKKKSSLNPLSTSAFSKK